ncbi:hypothetical protein [Sphingobacterium sp. WOUb80]|uniref:hypothetical protein n=2 Tax=unclassified Sphingobacterium TaxID=2609468 RepID=UPI003CE91FBA
MRQLKYYIKGVDLKTELLIGFSIVPFIILFGQLSIILFRSINHVEFRNIPHFVFLGGGLAGLSVGLLLAKILGKKMSEFWEIILINDLELTIRFKKRKWEMKLDEILKFKIYGSTNFKYVSIYTNNQVIKMRFGNSGLTPFSTINDLKELDNFMAEILPYFDKNYEKKDGTVQRSPSGTIKLTYLKK